MKQTLYLSVQKITAQYTPLYYFLTGTLYTQQFKFNFVSFLSFQMFLLMRFQKSFGYVPDLGVVKYGHNLAFFTFVEKWEIHRCLHQIYVLFITLHLVGRLPDKFLGHKIYKYEDLFRVLREQYFLLKLTRLRNCHSSIFISVS